MRPLFNLILFSCLFYSTNAKEYNILDFGAKADTTVLSTKAIQSAIDKCSQTGGKVTIPAGNFKTGSLTMKSNVNLHLEQGAVLYGSKNYNNYQPHIPQYTALRTRGKTKQLIYAENESNFSITGTGLIDGQGGVFPDKTAEGVQYDRPHLIQFINCKSVLIENISLKNSGCWMEHYLACEELTIRGIKVFNHSNKNNDGIDIDGCKNVIISDVIIDTDDDALCLKSTSGRANENISITNCVLSSHCNAFKLGTESNTGFKNISVSNLTIKPSAVTDKVIYGRTEGISGISIESVDGGFLDGIAISNVTMEGTASPIFVRLASRNRPYKDDQVIDQTSTIRNVYISHVIATGASETGCSITGIPGHPVENIRLSNISITFKGGGTKNEFETEIPEKEKSYPEATMFGNLPAYGFFIRHAENVNFANILLTTENKDDRPALYLDDVHNSEFQMMKLENAGSACHVLAKDCSDIILRENKVHGTAKVFTELNGTNNQNLFITNNVLLGVDKSHHPEDTKNAVIEFGNIKQYEEE